MCITCQKQGSESCQIENIIKKKKKKVPYDLAIPPGCMYTKDEGETCPQQPKVETQMPSTGE